MKKLLLALLLVGSVFLPESFAGKHKNGGNGGPDLKIVQVDPGSITVGFGGSGEAHLTYAITEKTTVTIDGAPAAARDLEAGMVAKIETGSDKATATAIHAKDSPAHPHKHRVG